MINNIKVEQFINSSGNEVKNQFIIRSSEGRYFQSYGSIIAFIPINRDDKTALDEHYWDYSTTTEKYRNQFLNEDKATTKKKIEAGEYILMNLN